MKGKVSCGPFFEKSLYERRTGYEKKRCGIWETVKGWFSLYEIKEAASPGGYLSGIYGLRLLRDLAAWTVAHGHFLVMGGFHVVEPPEDEGIPKQTRTSSTLG
jgi:hypothetical protein